METFKKFSLLKESESITSYNTTMKTIKIIDDKIIEVDGVIFVPYEKEKSEYKIPAWYKWCSDSDCEIFRATSQNDYYLFSNVSNYPKRECFSVTTKEIEEHLRNICDKYLGKRITELTAPYRNLSVVGNRNISYKDKYDQFWMTDSNGNGVCVYEDGIFAEIIP